jgi:hypothetical protein
MNKISEWMDGELPGQETRQQVDRVKGDGELQECWGTFHLIGDVLRGEHALSQNFERRLATRLAGEPTVLAPRSPRSRWSDGWLYSTIPSPLSLKLRSRRPPPRPQQSPPSRCLRACPTTAP